MASLKKLATQTVEVAKVGGRKAAAPGALWFLILPFLGVSVFFFFIGSGFDRVALPFLVGIAVSIAKFFNSPSKENPRERFLK